MFILYLFRYNTRLIAHSVHKMSDITLCISVTILHSAAQLIGFHRSISSHRWSFNFQLFFFFDCSIKVCCFYVFASKQPEDFSHFVSTLNFCQILYKPLSLNFLLGVYKVIFFQTLRRLFIQQTRAFGIILNFTSV